MWIVILEPWTYMSYIWQHWNTVFADAHKHSDLVSSNKTNE